MTESNDVGVAIGTAYLSTHHRTSFNFGSTRKSIGMGRNFCYPLCIGIRSGRRTIRDSPANHFRCLAIMATSRCRGNVRYHRLVFSMAGPIQQRQ